MAAWWTEAQIQARVDREFIASKLHPQEQVVLDKPLVFGDGLTDDTYIEWILEKARKLFLILLDIGVPDQVFGVVDDSFDDDDLPLSLEAVSQLKLSFQPDNALNKRFYRTQFNYLVRHIKPGEHGRYDVDEVVPVEPLKRRAEVLPNHSSERVHVPGVSSKVFARRKISLGYASGDLPEADFLAEVDAMKAITHEHIMSLWASYTQNHTGYILLTPVPEMSLKSFIADVPQQFKMLPKQRRWEVLLNWPHCLADALLFLHWNGFAHQEIRPSNVFVDASNNIFFGDIGSLKLKGPPSRKESADNEAYDYAAPEHWVKTPVIHQSPAPRSTLPGGGRTGRKISISSALPSRRSSYVSDASSLASYDTSAAVSTTTTSSSSSSSSGSTAILHKYRRLPTDPQRADIFSLACIYLDILSHVLKRKPSAFASHRASKNRSAGRGGAPADASFHVNLAQVGAWIDVLDNDAFGKDHQLFRAVPPMLALVAKMLARDPKLRPSVAQVEERLDDALFRFAHLERLHCGTKHFADGGVESRIGGPVGGYGAFQFDDGGGGGVCGGEGDGYGEENGGGGGGGRVTSALSVGAPTPSRRPSSKSSRSSGSTVRAKTWPLGGGSTDEVLGHFLSRD